MDRVCHFEIPYSDKERAEKFYHGVFGWQITHVPEMSYTFAITTEVDEQFMPKKVGGINGGMYERTESVSPTPVVVIEVPSCEKRLAEAEAAGGVRISDPAEVPGKGIYAMLKDPEGNTIGLWQPLH